MQIFVNKKIKQFFILGLASMVIFLISSLSMVYWKADYMEMYLIAFGIIMGMFILLAGYWYFREQSKLIEQAIPRSRAIHQEIKMSVSTVMKRVNCIFYSMR